MIKRDNFLEQFLDCDCYTLSNYSDISKLGRLCRSKHFLQCKVDISDTAFLSALLEQQFSLIETNVQLESNLTNVEFLKSDLNLQIRPVIAKDKQALSELSGSAFTNSRFHVDPKISNKSANDLKRKWTLNFFAGSRGFEMLVAESNERICGYLLLTKIDIVSAAIDLIAVNKSYRRKGIATALIEKAKAMCAELGFKSLRVGTQQANVTSLKLYKKLNFCVIDKSHVFHRHHNTHE